MSVYTIEIHPKKAAFDPLAKQVKHELLEAGQSASESVVETARLFRIEGDLTSQQIQNIADTLLVDPVVETAVVEGAAQPGKKAPKKAAKKGITVDVWPKSGVTDPVAETIEKGIRDLGYRGSFKACTAVRYQFPKMKKHDVIIDIVKKNLANELIHDISFR